MPKPYPCYDVHQGGGFNIASVAARLAPSEASACIFLAQQKRAGGFYALGALVDAIFITTSFDWWQLRRDSWRESFAVPYTTIEIEGVETDVYLLTPTWVSDLVTILDGGNDIPAGCTVIEHYP